MCKIVIFQWNLSTIFVKLLNIDLFSKIFYKVKIVMLWWNILQYLTKMLRQYFICNERLEIFLTCIWNILCYVGSKTFQKYIPKNLKRNSESGRCDAHLHFMVLHIVLNIFFEIRFLKLIHCVAIFTILYGNYYLPHGEFKLICIGKFARRTWVNFTQRYGKNRQMCKKK